MKTLLTLLLNLADFSVPYSFIFNYTEMHVNQQGLTLHLPRPIYENLPYLYFGAAGYLLLFAEDWHLYIPAVIFYAAACIILVARSANRRIDTMHHLDKRLILPNLLYEYMPYIYIAAGVFILLWSKNDLLNFAAFVIMIVAFRNLVCRHTNRIKQN